VGYVDILVKEFVPSESFKHGLLADLWPNTGLVQWPRVTHLYTDFSHPDHLWQKRAATSLEVPEAWPLTFPILGLNPDLQSQLSPHDW